MVRGQRSEIKDWRPQEIRGLRGNRQERSEAKKVKGKKSQRQERSEIRGKFKDKSICC